MKKYICSFVLLGGFLVPVISSASYEVCNLDQYSIIYINGILNSKSDADNGRFALERELNKFNLLNINNKEIAIRLAFNPSHVAGAGDSIKVLIQKTYDQIQAVTGLDYDSKEMLKDLSDEVKEGRILFVPHSQGNFYANSMYGWIVDQEDGLSTDSINMYNVASPTQLSAKKSKYILSKTDKVIAGLVGSVGAIAPPNTSFNINKYSKDSLGHNFVDSYLAYGGEQMVDDIKAQLEILKIDNHKDQTKPCIPSPYIGASHDLLSIFYKVVDPLANVVKYTVSAATSFSRGGLSAIASVFNSGEDSPDIINEGLTNDYPTISDTADSHVDVNIKTSKPAPVSILEYKTEIPPLPNQSTTQELNDELVTSYLRRIKELKDQIEKQKVQYVKYHGSGSSYSPPLTILPTDTSNPTTTATDTPPTATSTNTDIPPAASTTATSTPPGTSASSTDSLPEVVLGANIIPAGEVLNVDTPKIPIRPENGELMISEYYIGKEGEASWVEIFNTSKTEWIDTSKVVFMEMNNRFNFPVTAMAPYSSIVLRSEGKAIHELTDDSIPVSFSLQNYLRSEGGLYLILQNYTGGEAAIDFTYYGGNYCNNKYSYSRSCERMITIIPGGNEDYWVRSRVINSDMNPKAFSSVGKSNMTWEYDTHEGRKIKGIYSNEVIKRGNYGYASGLIVIPSWEERIQDYTDNLWVISSESALFGGENETHIDVYGKLRTIHTSVIDNYYDKNKSYINVYPGGIVIRDSYSTINVPIKIMGGAVRANFMSNEIILESGVLYLTNYTEDGHSPASTVCNDYRKGLTNLQWIGGELYIGGYSCGENNGTNENTYEEPFDEFGVIDKRVPKDCPVYNWNTNMELVCNMAPPLEEDPPIGGSGGSGSLPPQETASSTATSTDSTPVDENRVGRPPREGRLQITEYYIGKQEGDASWVRVSNMMKAAYVYLNNTDFIFNDTKILFPTSEILEKQYVILKSPGASSSTIPESLTESGITRIKAGEFEVLPNDLLKEGEFSISSMWGSLEVPEIIEKVPYSSTSCGGEITEYGSCKLNKPYLFWNDPSDGFIN